ncbi:MAG: hypothetical protein KGJ86_12205 [Chloroflexota bacterium]|nr:hypothetical protein [Chloroflexota bacterium]
MGQDVQSNEMGQRLRIRIIMRGFACGDTPYSQALRALTQACPDVSQKRLADQLDNLAHIRDDYGLFQH